MKTLKKKNLCNFQRFKAILHPINKNEILCKMKKKRIKKEFLEKGKFNRLTGIQIEELFQREKVEERKK